MNHRLAYVVLSCCTFVIAITLIPASASAASPTYAIVVGHNGVPEGRADLRPLRFADDDALRFYELLSRTSEEIVLLTNVDANTRRKFPQSSMHARTPTMHRVRQAARQIGERVRQDLERGDDPVVFLSYSGHGASDEAGEGYLTLAGAKLSRSVLMEEVLKGLEGARVHLFIDACNAASMVDARGAFDEELDTRSVQVQQATLTKLFSVRTPAGVGAFLAAAHEAQAHEWSQVQSGVFTHQAISGLSGAADINGDLRIEYGELHAFLAAANSDIIDPRARPAIKVRPPDGDANSELLDLSRMQGVRWLVGDASELGRFHVELASGQRLIEAHLGSDRRAVLALPEEANSYLVADEGEALIPLAAGPIVSLDSLEFSETTQAARGPVDLAFKEQMFRTPLTVAYYRGFMDSLGLPPTVFGAPRPLPGDELGSAQGSLAGTPYTPKDTSSPDRPKRLRWRRALFGTAGAAAAASIAPTVIAIRTWKDSKDMTGLTRAEQEQLKQRHQRSLGLAVTTGALAVGAALGGVFIKIPSESGKYELSLGTVSKFRVNW